MRKDVVVSVKTAVPAIITHWADLAEDQIASLARDVWYDDPTDQRQADLVFSLSLCKRFRDGQTTDELIELWNLIQDGCLKGDQPYGGFIHAEGRRNYRSTRKFMEALFAPRLMAALEAQFNKLAMEASRKPNSTDRIEALEKADSALRDVVIEFTLLPPWQKKLDKLHGRLSSLLGQLIDAEEG